MPDIEPERPHEAGTREDVPRLAEIESAHELAAEARPVLRRHGFDDDQITRCADAFIAQMGSGDVETFVHWIEREQRV